MKNDYNMIYNMITFDIKDVGRYTVPYLALDLHGNEISKDILQAVIKKIGGGTITLYENKKIREVIKHLVGYICSIKKLSKCEVHWKLAAISLRDEKDGWEIDMKEWKRYDQI